MDNITSDITDLMVARFSQGDETVLNELITAHAQRLIIYATRYVARADEAEDIVHEAFVKLWLKRKDLSNPGAIINFLQTVVRNGCLGYLRHQNVKNNRQQEIITLVEAGNDINPELEIIRMQVLNRIFQEVDSLPEKIRRVCLMSFQEGLRPAEIAERLNLSVQTVKNQKMSGIKMLKKIFKADPSALILLALWENTEHFLH